MSTAFLALDFNVGIADQPYAGDASTAAARALDIARSRKLPVVFTKVGFLPGHPDVAPWSRTFGALVGTDQLVGARSRIVDALAPRPDEAVLDKKRFSAFAGSGLWTLLRSQRIGSVVLCGLSTGGVVLSTALELIDADIDVTVLSDACADPERDVHETVLGGILGKRASILSVAAWHDATGTPMPPA